MSKPLRSAGPSASRSGDLQELEKTDACVGMYVCTYVCPFVGALCLSMSIAGQVHRSPLLCWGCSLVFLASLYGWDSTYIFPLGQAHPIIDSLLWLFLFSGRSANFGHVFCFLLVCSFV